MGNLFSCVLICGATEKVKFLSTTHAFEEADSPLPSVAVATQHSEEDVVDQLVESCTEVKALPATTREAQMLGMELTHEHEVQEIYFLIPLKISSDYCAKPGRTASLQLRNCSINLNQTNAKKLFGEMENSHVFVDKPPVMIQKHEGVAKVVVSKRYLSQVTLLEKKQKRREMKASNESCRDEPKASQLQDHHHSTPRSRLQRVGGWQPALDSISETQASWT